MKTQPATSVASASFDGVKNWHDLDWARIQQSVRKTQLKIAQATREGDWRRVKRLQRLLTHSFYGRCLAVRRVTENRVARRRVSMEKPGERLRPSSMPWDVCRNNEAIGPDRCGGYGYRSPVNRRNARWVSRRCWIGPCRRCISKRWSLSWSTSDPKSYGFRPDRSTADAMVELFHCCRRKRRRSGFWKVISKGSSTTLTTSGCAGMSRWIGRCCANG